MQLNINKCVAGASFILMMGMAACTNRGSGVPTYTQTSQTGSDQSEGIAKTTGGKEIFEQRCVACHGEYGNLRHENAANLQMSRLDSIGIVQTIQNGRNLMPPFKDAVPDSDIAKLAVYVKSLRK